MALTNYIVDSQDLFPISSAIPFLVASLSKTNVYIEGSFVKKEKVGASRLTRVLVCKGQNLGSEYIGKVGSAS